MASAKARGSSTVCQCAGRLLRWRSTLRRISVVAGLRCGNKDDAAGVFPKLLCVVAFAAARATKHECHRIPAGWAAYVASGAGQGPGAKRDKNKKAASVLIATTSARLLSSSPIEAETALVGIWPVS